MLGQLAFAYLTGNGDAHAKNFSVLQAASGEWRVSPIYDVPCSHVYGFGSHSLRSRLFVLFDGGPTRFDTAVLVSAAPHTRIGVEGLASVELT